MMKIFNNCPICGSEIFENKNKKTYLCLKDCNHYSTSINGYHRISNEVYIIYMGENSTAIFSHPMKLLARVPYMINCLPEEFMNKIKTILIFS